MKKKDWYSIGEMSRLCNVSRKTLRYYDKIGLISPQRQDCNNYRHYTLDALLAVPVIKFYKQMGFTLEEMRDFIEGRLPDPYRAMRKSFAAKLGELEREGEELRRKRISVKDWQDLILESETVIENDMREVSVKFVEATGLIAMEQPFDNDIKSAIINLDFTNYLEREGLAITGAVMLNFPSWRERADGRADRLRIMQKALDPGRGDGIAFGGCLMAACYHIGPHKDLAESYRKILDWSKKHGYALGEESFERYVTDYWTTRDSGRFVTEVLIRVGRAAAPS